MDCCTTTTRCFITSVACIIDVEFHFHTKLFSYRDNVLQGQRLWSKKSRYPRRGLWSACYVRGLCTGLYCISHSAQATERVSGLTKEPQNGYGPSIKTISNSFTEPTGYLLIWSGFELTSTNLNRTAALTCSERKLLFRLRNNSLLWSTDLIRLIDFTYRNRDIEACSNNLRKDWNLIA